MIHSRWRFRTGEDSFLGGSRFFHRFGTDFSGLSAGQVVEMAEGGPSLHWEAEPPKLSAACG